MKKKIAKRLTLQRETLKALENPHLRAVEGAIGGGTQDWTLCVECSESCQYCTINPQTLWDC